MNQNIKSHMDENVSIIIYVLMCYKYINFYYYFQGYLFGKYLITEIMLYFVGGKIL